MASGIRLAFSVIRPANLACVRFQSTAAQTKATETKVKQPEKGTKNVHILVSLPSD